MYSSIKNRLRSRLKKTEHDKTSELQLEGDEEIMQKDRGLTKKPKHC